jgi:hypothetical protein
VKGVPLGTPFNCSNKVEVGLEETVVVVVDPEETVGTSLGLEGGGGVIAEETAGARLGLERAEEVAVVGTEDAIVTVGGDTITFVAVVTFDCSVFFFGKR